MATFDIEGINFQQLESEKIWSFPSSYSDERKKKDTLQMVYSNQYLGSLKKDGFYYRFIKGPTGDMSLQGRNRGVGGDFLNKIGHLPHLAHFFNTLPNGTCLIGEIYYDSGSRSNEVSKIMGCKEATALTRQKTAKELLSYFVFDIWAYAGVSYLNTPAEERFKMLEALEKAFSSPHVKFAKYYRGDRMWKLYQTALANGEEGIVMTRADSVPEPGKRTARKTLKLKKELQETIDVFIVGANPPTRLYSGKSIETWPYWENVRTRERFDENKFKEYEEGQGYEPVTKNYYYQWAGSLKIGVMKGDDVYQVGSVSGLEDEVLANWRDYLGTVVEVTAMEVFKDTGALRHPKVLRFRDDLTPADCTYEKLNG